ncbi:MAG: hypothetical protein ACMXYF_01100 [Candidatus Woesearchaeota archaeon]
MKNTYARDLRRKQQTFSFNNSRTTSDISALVEADTNVSPEILASLQREKQSRIMPIQTRTLVEPRLPTPPGYQFTPTHSYELAIALPISLGIYVLSKFH